MFDPRKLQLIKNVENIKEFNGSMRRAIKHAGYSQSLADNPKVLTDRKWFKSVIPDYAKTANAMHDLMDSARLDHYIFPLSMSDAEIQELIESLPGCTLRKIKHGETQTWAYFWTPDNKSRKDAIDIVLKVRGDYAAEKLKIVDEYENLTDEEILSEIEELKQTITLRAKDGDSNG